MVRPTCCSALPAQLTTCCARARTRLRTKLRTRFRLVPGPVPGSARLLARRSLVVRPFFRSVVASAGLKQLALARAGQLVPSRGHLFQLLAMRRRGGTRHFPAFRGVFAVFVQFFHSASPSQPTHIMSAGPFRSGPAAKTSLRGSARYVGMAGARALVVPQPAAFGAAAEAQAQETKAKQRGKSRRYTPGCYRLSRHRVSLTDYGCGGHRASAGWRSRRGPSAPYASFRAARRG